MREFIEKVRSGRRLSREESHIAMNKLLRDATDKEIYDFLIIMNTRETSLDELVGFVWGMREHANLIKPKIEKGKNLVDTCGTGGDGYNTINVSTAAAIVAAAAGIPVAKHGNYSISSQSGSANVLEELGYNIHMSPKKCEKMIEKLGFAFLFAPNFHPAMKRVASIRKQIGRTIFNKLGPLCNPANATAQLVGVYDESLCEPFCYALNDLGVRRALVVCSRGLDEISNVNETVIYKLDSERVNKHIFTPEKLGVPRVKLEDIRGGTPEENAEYMLRIFDGARGPLRDFVILNAGAAIYLSGDCNSLQSAIVCAGETIDSGAAARKTREIVDYSKR